MTAYTRVLDWYAVLRARPRNALRSLPMHMPPPSVPSRTLQLSEGPRC